MYSVTEAMVLMPGAGYEGITDFVLDQMTTYGLNACPPLLVGVGVGTSVETAALNSKKALMRPIVLTTITQTQQKWRSFSRMVSMPSALDRRVWAEVFCNGC